MEYQRKELDVYRQGKTITDQFYVDDDYNVPDAKSDVKHVILSEGNLLLEDLRMQENYIRSAGKLNFKILYVADEDPAGPGVLEGRIPFEEMIYMEEPCEGNLFVKDIQTDLSVTVIHSRKLNIKAFVELQICCQGREEIRITMDAEAEIPLYKKHRKQELLNLRAMKKDTFRIKEETTLEGTKESIGSLLWTEVLGRKLDTRLAENMLLLNGELLFFCLYKSPDGKTDWIERTLPYEGKIDCPGAAEHMYHHIYPAVTDISVEPRMDEDGEMRALGVEATLEVRMFVCEEETVEILEDVYSLQNDCVMQTEEKEAECLLMQNHSKCKISEKLSLPEIKDDILQICHSSARIQIEHTEPEKDGIRVEGMLHIYFLYVKADDFVPFSVWEGMVPFSYLLESNQTSGDMRYDITCAVEQLSVGLLGSDEIEIKAVLAFNSFLRRPVRIENMEQIQCSPADVEELEKRPGIVGYTVKEGDDLWSLAKHYHTTKERIMEVNGLAAEEVLPGDKILIFKENMCII